MRRLEKLICGCMSFISGCVCGVCGVHVFFVSVCLYVMSVCVCVCLYMCVSVQRIHRKHLLCLACVSGVDTSVQWIPSRWCDSAFCLEVIFMHLNLGRLFPSATGPWAFISNSCVTVQHHTKNGVHLDSLQMGWNVGLPREALAGPESLHFYPPAPPPGMPGMLGPRLHCE